MDKLRPIRSRHFYDFIFEIEFKYIEVVKIKFIKFLPLFLVTKLYSAIKLFYYANKLRGKMIRLLLKDVTVNRIIYQ